MSEMSPERAVPADVTHFAVPGSQEMLLDEPQPCPAYPGLTLDGLAVAPDGQHHFLVVTVRPPTKPTIRLYLGPDPELIARHGLILVAALRTHGGHLAGVELGIGILTWLAACWTEAAAEIDDAISQFGPSNA